MKQISLMRHADAPMISGRDFDRKLSDIGLIQAEKAAAFLKANYHIDFLLTSDAPRVLETSKFIENVFPNAIIERGHSIYNGSSTLIINRIEDSLNSYSHILVLGHNPTIFQVACEFADKEQKKYSELAFAEMCPAKIISFSTEPKPNAKLLNNCFIESIFETTGQL